MQLQVKGKNTDVPEPIRAYAEQKLGKLARQLPALARIEVELAVEHNPSIADSNIAEATVWSKGPVLRARESSPDMRASIDLLADKLERRVTRYREKRNRHHDPRSGRRASLQVAPGEATPIVKSKHFALGEMSPEDAVDQLELVGHDFFVFRNGDTHEINVVYRRRDGAYGLIEPA